MQNKESIRKLLREKRCAFKEEDRLRAAFSASIQLSEHALFKNSVNISVYFSQEGEFETRPFIEKIWEHQKKCYLPKVLSNKKTLQFFLYNINDRIRLNRFKIGESENSERIDCEDLDLVLMPLLGFDLKGHRLGLGGGYYDATFAFKLNRAIKKPFLLGVGFEEQAFLELPYDSWDVPLDGILTEKRLIIF